MAPSIIGVFSASLGFAGVFTMTTSVLAVGVVVLLAWGVKTKGYSLEALTPTKAEGVTVKGKAQRQRVEG